MPVVFVRPVPSSTTPMMLILSPGFALMVIAALTGRWRDRSPAMTFDADRTGNGQRAVVGRIEHVDLAVGGRRRIGGREVPAGRRDVGAVIAVAARCRDEGAGRPRSLRRRGRQQASKSGCEQNGWKSDLAHDSSPVKVHGFDVYWGL